MFCGSEHSRRQTCLFKQVRQNVFRNKPRNGQDFEKRPAPKRFVDLSHSEVLNPTSPHVCDLKYSTIVLHLEMGRVLRLAVLPERHCEDVLAVLEGCWALRKPLLTVVLGRLDGEALDLTHHLDKGTVKLAHRVLEPVT